MLRNVCKYSSSKLDIISVIVGQHCANTDSSNYLARTQLDKAEKIETFKELILEASCVLKELDGGFEQLADLLEDIKDSVNPQPSLL